MKKLHLFKEAILSENQLLKCKELTLFQNSNMLNIKRV